MSVVERLKGIRDRIQNGIAPAEPIEDVRFLLGVIHGDNEIMALSGNFHEGTCRKYIEATYLPPRRKRCSECHGEGTLKITSDYGVEAVVQCHACYTKDGESTGYQEAKGT